MDPNATLRRVQALSAQLLDLVDDGESGPLVMARMAQLGCELAQAVSDLDSWMRVGGFPPAAWQRSKKEERV